MTLRAVTLVAVLGAAVDAAVYYGSLARGRSVVGLRAGAWDVGGLDAAALERRLDAMERAFADGELTFTLGDEMRRIPRARVGVTLDRAELRARILRVGRSGRPWRDLHERVGARRGRVRITPRARVDMRRAIEHLDDLKNDVDRPAREARLDLDSRSVSPEQPGALLRVYDTLAALERAVLDGRDRVALVASAVEPNARRADLGGIDISSVLSSWETKFSQSPKDADRAWNLKLVAGKLDGTILAAGGELSFNGVVGDRTEKEGYRTAPVISAGELVDGLAGGACQISSTLHAAAFFAGLEILRAQPHSRPSGYIVMGLDATVIFPNVDLRLRNPYDFPVVIHAKVALGSAVVEIFGKARPYRVAFERETVEETPFRRETRFDPEIPKGQTRVEQVGLKGFRLLRRRVFLDGKREVRREEWKVSYPSTTEYVRVGTQIVTGKLPPPPDPPHLPKILQNPAALLRIER